MGIPRSPLLIPISLLSANLSLLSTPVPPSFAVAVLNTVCQPLAVKIQKSALFSIPSSLLLVTSHHCQQYNFSVVEIYDFTFLLVLATFGNVLQFVSQLAAVYILAHRNSIPKALHAETCQLPLTHDNLAGYKTASLLSFPEAVTLLSSGVNCFVKKFGGRLIFFLFITDFIFLLGC